MGVAVELDMNLSKPSIGRCARGESSQSDAPSSEYLSKGLGQSRIGSYTRSHGVERIDNMKKLKFKVRLEGIPGMDTAALSAPFDVAGVFGTRARVL